MNNDLIFAELLINLTVNRRGWILRALERIYHPGSIRKTNIPLSWRVSHDIY